MCSVWKSCPGLCCVHPSVFTLQIHGVKGQSALLSRIVFCHSETDWVIWEEGTSVRKSLSPVGLCVNLWDIFWIDDWHERVLPSAGNATSGPAVLDTTGKVANYTWALRASQEAALLRGLCSSFHLQVFEFPLWLFLSDELWPVNQINPFPPKLFLVLITVIESKLEQFPNIIL